MIVRSEPISGYQTREEATTRLTQTLTNLKTIWPRETFSGFLVHFTNRNMDALSEFSTIDTTIAVLGAMFAGNYFGGEVRIGFKRKRISNIIDLGDESCISTERCYTMERCNQGLKQS